MEFLTERQMRAVVLSIWGAVFVGLGLLAMGLDFKLDMVGGGGAGGTAGWPGRGCSKRGAHPAPVCAAGFPCKLSCKHPSAGGSAKLCEALPGPDSAMLSRDIAPGT